jgi:SAM-dependent methyltransferase
MDIPRSRVGAPLARSVLHRAKRLVSLHPDYIKHNGSRLPPDELRFDGPEQQDDDTYLASSLAEASRVLSGLCAAKDLLVDIGCGPGRLATGLVIKCEELRYLGIDVSAKSIAWCKRNIQSRYPSFRFQHIDIVNGRYNLEGSGFTKDLTLPVRSEAADAVYTWGVVTNMEPAHLPGYASEIGRILKPAGRLFLTANIEAHVPDVAMIPKDHTALACHAPLRSVRYSIEYFLNVFRRAGLKFVQMDNDVPGDGQTGLYFVKDELTWRTWAGFHRA